LKLKIGPFKTKRPLNRKENREMAETYPYPVEGCDHAPFKTIQALATSEVATRGLGKKGPAKEAPIVEKDFTIA